MKRAIKVSKTALFTVRNIFLTIFLILIFVPGCSNDESSDDDDYISVSPKGVYEYTGYSHNLIKKDNTVYILASNIPEEIFYAIDVTNPENPELIEKYTANLESTTGMDIEGDYAYILDEHSTGTDVLSEIKKIDISSSPFTQSGTPLSIPGSPKDIIIKDGYAFIANSETGLQVVDLTNFDNVEATISLSGQPYVLEIHGNLAFVAGNLLALEIIDISDPLNPQKIGSLIPPYAISPHDIAVTGNYAALPCGGHGTGLVDITDPANPEVISINETSGWAESITFDGNYVYLADGDTGVVIIDVSDFQNYIIKGICRTDGYAREIAVSGNHVYTTVNDKGLMIFDVSGLL